MHQRITSVHNPHVKSAVRLRERRGRDEQQRIVIDGGREIARACRAGVKIVEVFAEESSLSETDRATLALAEQSGAVRYDVSPAVLQKLAYGDRDSGPVAVAETPHRTLATLSLPEDALVAVLEGIEKPGNLGAVVRSADATGLAAVLVADGRTDLFNPNAIRASAGTIFSVPVVSASVPEVQSWLAAGGFRSLAARVEGGTCYWQASYAGRVALVLGSEASGLSSAWEGPSIQPISLPQHGMADSLNVSVTAAVLFYEALRQRTPR